MADAPLLALPQSCSIFGSLFDATAGTRIEADFAAPAQIALA
jgi:hypothetical protein